LLGGTEFLVLRASNYTAGSLAEKAQQWLNTIRSTVNVRDNLVIDPESCALVITDMNNHFASPNGRSFLPGVTDIIPNIRNLLKIWRTKKGTIVFTRHGHTGPDDLGMLGKFFSDYIHEDSPDSEIIDQLSPGDMEKVVHKKTYDAFLGTNLEQYLKNNSVTQVLITGVLTHMCCETTARSAFCRGFEVFMPVDALAAGSEQAHVDSIRNLASCVCVPLSTREVLEQCDR